MAELRVPWRERWLPVVLAVAGLAAGLVFRFWNVASEPLWLDEAYSAFAADHGFAFLWHVVPRYETHPPFYYALVRVWSLILGDGLAARRLLGLACGLGTVVVAGVAARRIARLTRLHGRQRQWFIATVILLMSVQPLMIEVSRQLRPYPVMTLVYAFGLLALLRLAEDGVLRRAPDRRAIVLFFATQAVMLWLHSLGPLFAVAMTLALVAAVLRPGLSRRDWQWLIGGQIAAGIAYLPALLILLGQAPTWVKGTWLVFTPALVPVQVGQIYIDWNLWARLAGAVVAVLGAMMLLRRMGGRRVLAILLLLAIVPVALSLALSATLAPVFLDRTLSPATLPALLLVSAGLAWPRRWAPLALVPAAILAGSMLLVDWHGAKAGPVQDWYGVTAWLAPRVAAGDRVWAYPNEGALPLAYALHDERRWLPIRQVPAPMPALDTAGYYPTGSRGVVALYPTQIAALTETGEATAPPVIWLLRLTPQLYDVGDPMLHALERDRIVIAHFRRGPIDVTGLRRRDLAPVATAEQAKP